MERNQYNLFVRDSGEKYDIHGINESRVSYDKIMEIVDKQLSSFESSLKDEMQRNRFVNNENNYYSLLTLLEYINTDINRNKNIAQQLHSDLNNLTSYIKHG